MTSSHRGVCHTCDAIYTIGEDLLFCSRECRKARLLARIEAAAVALEAASHEAAEGAANVAQIAASLDRRAA